MTLVEFPRRGRKFCPMCDTPVLTVVQLDHHIRECPVRIARSKALHPSNHGTHRQATTAQGGAMTDQGNDTGRGGA